MATVEYLTNAVDAGGPKSPYTFSSQTFGTAAADRYIIACFGWNLEDDSTSNTLSGVTIGGVTATLVNQTTLNNTSTNDRSGCGMYIANVPTGTSGDVVATFTTGASGGPHGCGVGLFRVTGINPTKHDDGVASADTNANPSTTIDCPANGIIVGVSDVAENGASAGETATWAGLTESFDATIRTSVPPTSFSCAILNPGTTQTGLTVTPTWTRSSVNVKTLVVASFEELITPTPSVSDSTTTGESAQIAQADTINRTPQFIAELVIH